MTFTLPQNVQEFFIVLVPFVTLLLGLAFFILPGRMFYIFGLEAKPGKSEAIGEGRSAFAPGMLAVALGCLLLQEPIALQPGLNFMLALGWSAAIVGRILQMVFDGGLRRKRVQARFLIAVTLALLAWSVTEIPYFACSELSAPTCLPGSGFKDWLLFVVATLMACFGVLALLLPSVVLKVFNIQTRINQPFARGEVRGALAGFHFAIGGTYLMMPQPVDFVALVMGGAWLIAGIGRLISVLFNRGWTLFNLAGLVIQTGIGLVCIGYVLRIL